MIVDLGCGEGLTLEKLISKFPTTEILGIDLLEENVEICSRHSFLFAKVMHEQLIFPKEALTRYFLWKL